MGLFAKVFLCFILLHLPWRSGYVKGNETNVEEGQRINRQLISGGGGRGGGRSGSSSSSSNHGSGSTTSRKSPYASNGNNKSYGTGTASKKQPFTPYGVVYAAGAANHNNNNNHRNMAAPLSCNRNNVGLLTALTIAIFLVAVLAS